MSGKLTNGLAWAGVIVVVGVLSADFISSKFAPSTDSQPTELSVQTPVTAPIMPMPASARPKPTVVAKPTVAAAKPAAVAVPKPVQAVAVAVPVMPQPDGTVVGDYLASGKALPSYITGAPSAVAAAPVQPVTVPVAAVASVAPAAIATPVIAGPTDPIQVGAIDPQIKIAPVPMPLSMRPKAPVEPPLIIDEATVQPAAALPEPVPFADDQNQDQIVGTQDLQDWQSGPLSEFLAKRRSHPQRSSATYDSNGFYLNDGPNSRSQARYIGPVDDGGY